MKIAVIGRGNVGGGLAEKWEQAGHSVTRIGKDGGDVSDAEAVLIAVRAARSRTRSTRSRVSKERRRSTRRISSERRDRPASTRTPSS